MGREVGWGWEEGGGGEEAGQVLGLCSPFSVVNSGQWEVGTVGRFGERNPGQWGGRQEVVRGRRHRRHRGGGGGRGEGGAREGHSLHHRTGTHRLVKGAAGPITLRLTSPHAASVDPMFLMTELNTVLRSFFSTPCSW